jgi:hypothetical protein
MERRIYKTASGLACKVEVVGSHRCVKVDETGVWPLVNELKPKITVTIGKLVRRKVV